MRNRVSRKDVAMAAGVSTTAVSFVMNGRRDMGLSEETFNRVLAVAKELGYTPNRMAQALTTGRTNNIALWASMLSTMYHSQVVDHVQSSLYQSGYEMMVTDTWTHRDRVAHLERLAHWPVDGIIAFDSPDYVRDFAQKFPQMHIPVVTMGASVIEERDHVLVDLYPGALEAMRHLVDKDCKRVAYVSDRFGIGTDEPRYMAYTEASQDAGISREVILVSARAGDTAREEFVKYVREHGCPDRLFCYNDELAIRVHRALNEMGIRMPDDVRLVGHDGVPYTDLLTPSLSTVVLPFKEMCDKAMEFLRNRMENPDLPVQHCRLNTYLKPAESSSGNSRI